MRRGNFLYPTKYLLYFLPTLSSKKLQYRKSPHSLVILIKFCYIFRSPKLLKRNSVKHSLIILISLLLLSSPVNGQSGKPQTIIIPTGSLGEMSNMRIKILEKTLESKIVDHFAIVPKELFEKAQEQAFQEMDSDEC